MPDEQELSLQRFTRASVLEELSKWSFCDIENHGTEGCDLDGSRTPAWDRKCLFRWATRVPRRDNRCQPVLPPSGDEIADLSGPCRATVMAA